jgi:DNA (cytosine-5)-methyltransferase 1
MSLGFQRAGFDIVSAYDNWQPAVSVYRSNFKHPAYCQDIYSSTLDDEIVAQQPDVIIGGPPCQDFSSAGPNKPESVRASLVTRFVDIVLQARPAVFVMENVPRTRLRPVFIQAKERLAAAGYQLIERVLDAALCGVPQTRERLFLIGVNGAAAAPIGEYLDSALASKPMTLRDYFGAELGTDYYFRVPTNYSRHRYHQITSKTDD